MEKFQRTPVPEGANNDDLVDAMATLFGITFAPEPSAQPARKWPAKLVATDEGDNADIRVQDRNGQHVGTICSYRFGNPAFRDEAIRRWNLCEELELTTSREIINLERQRDALLAELAERTRERDAAREDASSHLAAYVTAHQERSAVTAERDELRRRSAAAEEMLKPLAHGHGQPIGCLWAWQILRGTRPIPGEDPTDA